MCVCVCSFNCSIMFGSGQRGGLEGVAVNQGQRRGSPSFVIAISRAFGFTFFVAGIFKVGNDLLSFVSPMILK